MNWTVNWTLIRGGLFFICMTSCFTLGRLSVEFRGTRADWTMLALLIVALISALIGLASAMLVRAK
jgi:hypothetical protein